MTKEEKELIFNRLFELEEKHPAFAENVRDNAYCEAIADVKRIIDGIKEPSLPSNLDEAAEKNFETMEVLEHENIFEETHRKIFKAGAEWMQNKMFSLRFENEPLDSAARNVFKEWIPMEILTIDGIDGGIPLYNQGALIMMFDAGAEWMAGQGIKLHGRILPGPKCNLYIESDCFDRGYKGLNYSFSDSNDVDMFIQIRKK